MRPQRHQPLKTLRVGMKPHVPERYVGAKSGNRVNGRGGGGGLGLPKAPVLPVPQHQPQLHFQPPAPRALSQSAATALWLLRHCRQSPPLPFSQTPGAKLTMGGVNRDILPARKVVELVKPSALGLSSAGRGGLGRVQYRQGALEGRGPQGPPQEPLGRQLEEVAKATGGGYCQLQMPLRLALGVRGTVAGHRLRAPGTPYLCMGTGWMRTRSPLAYLFTLGASRTR